ncbi:MAG: hypothetical protein D5S01_09615 [Halanaerobium sp. MSAO_Bac5]|nr:MAG: hypothetical protein D5S01_09615 [Halanaerobium sp. MSAO_Bac5]
MSFKKSIIFSLIILFFIFAVITTVSAEEFQRAPRFNLRGITGDDFIGQAGILYPFRNKEDSLWYTDLRYRMSEDDVDEWNLGLGYRYKLDNVDNHIAGVYLFRDRRKEYEHYWDMWTIGGEVLTDQLDFRLNAYITDDDIVSAPELDEVVVENQRLVYQEGAYASMDGLDFEVGKRFTDTEGIFNDVGIYAKAFKFFESSTETMTGKQLRVDKQFGDRDRTTWKLGLQWRDDNIRGSDTEATFAVSIPFGSRDDNAERTAANDEYRSEEILEARMTEQPERDLDVIVGESYALRSDDEEQNFAFDFAGGEELGTVWYVTADGDGDGDGSREDPIGLGNDSSERLENDSSKESNNDLPEENDVIILLGDGGTFETSQPLQLQEGQKLLSPGGFLTVAADAEGSRKTQFRPEGESAKLKFGEQLQSTGDITTMRKSRQGFITLADNTTVSGLEIDVPEGSEYIIGEFGISGEINISNNIISGSSSYAIAIEADSDEDVDINITGNDITGFSDGIVIEDKDFVEASNEATNEININISDNRLLNDIELIGIRLSIQSPDILTLQGNEFSDMDTGVLFNFEEVEGLREQIKADNEFNEIDEGNEVTFQSIDK